MNIDDNTKRFVIDRLKWIGFYTGISFILLFLAPTPYDIVSVFGILTLITYLRMRRIMKRYGTGMGRIKEMFGLPPSSMFANNRSLRYYCMSCGKEHREIACPYCGSKMKRAG
jgi:hypothetical protein